MLQAYGSAGIQAVSAWTHSIYKIWRLVLLLLGAFGNWCESILYIVSRGVMVHKNLGFEVSVFFFFNTVRKNAKHKFGCS